MLRVQEVSEGVESCKRKITLIIFDNINAFCLLR